jgi:hypothetical protein
MGLFGAIVFGGIGGTIGFFTGGHRRPAGIVYRRGCWSSLWLWRRRRRRRRSRRRRLFIWVLGFRLEEIVIWGAG